MAKANIAESRKETESKGFNLSESSLATMCDKAVKASHEAFPAIQEAGINALLFFAHHGRADYMNRLQRELRPEHALAYRGYFLARLTLQYGEWFRFKPFSMEGGEAKGGYSIFKGTAEKGTDKTSKEAREKIKAMSFDELKKIPWVSPENADRDATPYTAKNFFNSIKAAVNRAVRENVIKVDEAKKFANLLPEDFRKDVKLTPETKTENRAAA